MLEGSRDVDAGENSNTARRCSISVKRVWSLDVEAAVRCRVEEGEGLAARWMSRQEVVFEEWGLARSGAWEQLCFVFPKARRWER